MEFGILLVRGKVGDALVKETLLGWHDYFMGKRQK